jgi:hypothetical protein
MPIGMKHLITCRCVLPQFKRRTSPPPHQFAVFSIVEDNGDVRVKFAQCNNCGVVHKVKEINRSEIVNRDAMRSLPTLDDIKVGLPPQLVGLLEANKAEIASYEQAQFILEGKRWGEFIVLDTDEEDGLREGKYVKIVGDSMFKVETFVRAEEVRR